MIEKDASKNNSFAVADFDSDEEGLPVRIDSGKSRFIFLTKMTLKWRQTDYKIVKARKKL